MTSNTNPTDKTYPYKRDDTFKDSQVSYDSDNDLINVTVPVIFPRAYRTESTEITFLLTDEVIEYTSASSNDATLPTAIGIKGRLFTLDNSGAGVATLKTILSQTINNLSSQTIASGNTITVISNGANWRIK